MTVRAAILTAALSAAGATSAQTVYWNFGTSSANASPSANTADSVSAGDVSIGNTLGTVTMLSTISASSGYTGASGQYNAGNAARTGALNTGSSGSAYFEFTLTPSAGRTLAVTNISFGTRSTSTAPQAFCLRSSLDGYAADLATGTIINNSTWALKSASLTATSSVPGSAVTFRIYGYNGTGSPSSGTINWRIDDLTVWANAAVGAATTPPGISQVPAQSVRIGKTLTVNLTITPTDGDDVTYTNATASAGVTGGWSLENGVFSYSPDDDDLGTRSFEFAAADKDGTNTMTLSVNVLRRQTEAVVLDRAAGEYAQDFDALASTGTANEWDNAAYPLPAWYAYTATELSSYRTGIGTDTAGGLYSWGTDTDRSLGSLASSGNTYRYGVAFTNATGQALTNLAVAFTAEQRRVGANAATNTLVCEMCVTNRVLPLTEGAWTRVQALCFDSPLVTNAVQSAGACYVAAAKRASFTRPIPAGAVVILRWTDADDTGNDHGFGIDDLSVIWAAGEPADAIAVGREGVSESFDSMGGAAGAELPWLWRVESRDDAPRVSGAYAAASERAQWANAVVNFTYAGSYNFSSSTAGDQAVGGLGSASAAKSVTVFGKFRNVTGGALRRWKVAYNVEKYRNGPTGCAVRLLVSTDGETWTAAGEPTAFEADADTNGYPADARPGATVAVETRADLGAALAEGGVFYLAWQISATAGESTADAQALGVDDVTIMPDYLTGTLIMME